MKGMTNHGGKQQIPGVCSLKVIAIVKMFLCLEIMLTSLRTWELKKVRVILDNRSKLKLSREVVNQPPVFKLMLA